MLQRLADLSVTDSGNNHCKDTNKRARNMKLASIFFTASGVYLRFYRKDTNKHARKQVFRTVYLANKKIRLKFAASQLQKIKDIP